MPVKVNREVLTRHVLILTLHVSLLIIHTIPISYYTLLCNVCSNIQYHTAKYIVCRNLRRQLFLKHITTLKKSQRHGWPRRQLFMHNAINQSNIDYATI